MITYASVYSYVLLEHVYLIICVLIITSEFVYLKLVCKTLHTCNSKRLEKFISCNVLNCILYIHDSNTTVDNIKNYCSDFRQTYVF